MPDVEFEPPEDGHGKLFAMVIVAAVAFAYVMAWLIPWLIEQADKQVRP